MSYSFIGLGESDGSDVLRFADLTAFPAVTSLGAAFAFTAEREQLLKRQRIVRAASETDGFGEFLREIGERAREYGFMRRERSTKRENQFITLLDARFYTSFVDYVCLEAEKFGATDSVFDDYFKLCREERASEQFRSLSENLERLNATASNVKSVTLGVNLSSSLKPLEAGLVRINDRPYRSGDFLDRLFRLDFNDDGFVCMAPLTRYGGDKNYGGRTALNNALNEALGEVMNSALKSSKASVDNYFYSRLEVLLPNAADLAFLSAACAYIDDLRSHGAYFCYPEIAECSSRVSGIYDPSMLYTKAFADIVKNDAVFAPADAVGDIAGDTKRLYILTGPNSGGKTVFLRALGTVWLIFQSGLPVPAKSASLVPCDNINTAFPASLTRTDVKNREGRLEEECRYLADMLPTLGERSLVLCDEVYSSTSASDAEKLANNWLHRVASMGSMCVFATHLHELTSSAPDCCGRLAAGASRTYKIISGSSADSGALLIAQKYGLI
ncbi:MAG: hypothetical protein WCQ72_00785 [Eubacteriales bacterium]